MRVYSEAPNRTSLIPFTTQMYPTYNGKNEYSPKRPIFPHAQIHEIAVIVIPKKKIVMVQDCQEYCRRLFRRRMSDFGN